MCLKSFKVFIIWFRMELKVNNLEKCMGGWSVIQEQLSHCL